MISLGKLFSRYTGALRGLKLAYVANNLLNSSRLQHNKALYKKYGLRKSMVAHYFCEGVICYHEISQRPALLEGMKE